MVICYSNPKKPSGSLRNQSQCPLHLPESTVILLRLNRPSTHIRVMDSEFQVPPIAPHPPTTPLIYWVTLDKLLIATCLGFLAYKMWLILVPVLQGGFEDEVSCTSAFRAVVLLSLLSPMTLFTWVWDGEKDTLHLQHLSPPALSKYAPASVQWVVKVQHAYCCEICFGDEGDRDSKHK